MLPLITRRCNHSVGVAICLIRRAPRRIAKARPTVASSSISRLGLSTPSPNPFALTSTRCYKIAPRSRIFETQPIPEAATLTAAQKSASALERLTTACVFDVDFKRCLSQKILQELVRFLLCRHPAKFESMQHVICLGTISCLSKLWMHRGYFNKKRMHLFSASTSAVVGSAIDLANSLLANFNSIRSADKYASRMTLERYDVESCGGSLIVRELSLARSHSFAVCLQTRFFDQQF